MVFNKTINKRFDPDTHYAVAMQPPPAYTHHIKRRYLDVPYTPFAKRSLSHTLDIYLPDVGEGPFPVILSFHGGAFMGCDKADMQLLPMLEGLRRGYAVVAVNYGLSWEAAFPALVQDAKAALRWMRGNAHLYYFDSERIAAWGGSAGGYLSTMLGVSAGIPELEDLSLGYPEQPSHVREDLRPDPGQDPAQHPHLPGRPRRHPVRPPWSPLRAFRARVWHGGAEGRILCRGCSG